MAVLKQAPLVTFDVNNLEHVRAILEILEGNTDPAKAISRSVKINFDYPHPFASAVAYATYCMAKAWGHNMLGEPKAVEVPDLANVRRLPVIGSKSKPLQENPSRSLPPGTLLA